MNEPTTFSFSSIVSFFSIIIPIIGWGIEYYFLKKKDSSDPQIIFLSPPAPAEIVITPSTIPCPKCKRSNRSSDEFCVSCGTRLYKDCKKCQRKIPAVDKKCGSCGMSPSDYTAMEKHMDKFQIKTIILTVAAAINVSILAIINVQYPLSIFIVLAIIVSNVGLGWEAFEDLGMLRQENIYEYRDKWLPKTTQAIFISHHLLVTVLGLIPVQLSILVLKI
ncbi:MAG: zinc ribbon domain-containing protein [Ardenticatenaceae bacterium]|nr:zinc ribbon domain-containing protein [Anaerolineales bacterium]MCB8920159.1 zinc ribbon domain-containing protein [Ardenticatenaceae bacterium]MCB9005046.1 zinc ribbon domain-containing protein [Ardenticatenaceae bacterium]